MQARAVSIVTAAFAVLVAAQPAAGSTVSPTQYRADVNAYCRSFTPRLATIEKKQGAAEKAHDDKTFFMYLGQGLAIDLIEVDGIKAAVVPAPLQAQLEPTIRLLGRMDSAIRAFFALSESQTVTTASFNKALQRTVTLIAPLNRALDAAGLPNCGSRQQ